MIGIFEIGIIMMVVPAFITLIVLLSVLCITLIQGIYAAYKTRDVPSLLVGGLVVSLLIGSVLVIVSGV